MPPVSPDTIIVVTTDQQRADFCAREGFGVDCTPTVDALARRGCWFPRAYTAAPVCVPARVSLLTGRFPSAHGVRENHGYAAPRYTEDLMDLGRTAGLRTALIGKNHSHLTADRVDHLLPYGHLGQQEPGPASEPERAFDAWLRELGARVSSIPTPHPPEVQMPARLVTHAIDWLEAGRDQRSLLWLSFPEPHVPYQVSEPYFSAYDPSVVPPPDITGADPATLPLAWRWVRELGHRLGEDDAETLQRARASYVGMIRLIDDQLARLVRHLEDTGRMSSTLLVFHADHGDFAGDYGLMRKGPGMPEVLQRIPLVFSGAGVEAAPEPSPAHVSITDILPTVCDLMDWPLPAGVQGRSLAPLLRAEPVPEAEFDSVYAEQGIGGIPYRDGDIDVTPRDAAPGQPADTLNEVTQGGSLRMVRSGRWKLQADATGRMSLFDLETDPYELDNRYGNPDYADISTLMVERLAAWLIRTADPLPIPANGYPRKRHPHNYFWIEDGPRRWPYEENS